MTNFADPPNWLPETCLKRTSSTSLLVNRAALVSSIATSVPKMPPSVPKGLYWYGQWIEFDMCQLSRGAR